MTYRYERCQQTRQEDERETGGPPGTVRRILSDICKAGLEGVIVVLVKLEFFTSGQPLETE